jgi:hypothetical protein
LIVLAALSGCDVPTELPEFDVRWVVPLLEDTISVAQLLPGTGVVISGGNFQVDADTVTLNETLGSLCGACIDSGGILVPKPVFNLVYNQTGLLATDVVSVQLVSGSISLAIQNDLGFDPIRPAPGVPGTMTVTVYDNDVLGRQLAQVTLDGATDALPDGALTTIPLNLAPGTVSSTIFTEVSVFSPAGDDVAIDLNARLDITAAVGTVLVSSALIDVDGRSVTLDPTTLDVDEIDSDITSRIQNGSIILDIQNPFGVGVDLSFDISGSGFATLQRAVSISSAATSTVTISYTGADFRSFLGAPNVQASGAGAVVAPGGPATVTPTQELVFEARIDLTVTVGGSGTGP